MIAPLKIMLVDDDPLESRILRNTLNGYDYELTHFEALPESDVLCGICTPDVLLLDHDVPPTGRIDGNLREVRARGYEGPVFLYTNLASAAVDVSANENVRYVSKDTDAVTLIGLLDAFRDG